MSRVRQGDGEGSGCASGQGASDGPVPDQALDWFIRLRAPDRAEEEHQAFADWRSQSAAHEEAYRRVESIWDSPAFGLAAARTQRRLAAADRAGVDRRGGWMLRRPGRRRIAAIAATVLLAVALGWGTGLPVHLAADYVTATGERETVTLADGSRLMLDTGTALAVELNGAVRHVRLIRGSAFFEVTPDPERPFEVTAGPARIRVVGTAFAVRQDGAGALVTVRSGIVEAGNGTEAVRLGPGRQASITTAAVGAAPVDLDQALAWADGRLVFVDRPLAAVLAELDRYHSGFILVADQRIGRLRVTGNYRLDDPVKAVAALADIAGAELIRLTDAVLILR